MKYILVLSVVWTWLYGGVLNAFENEKLYLNNNIVGVMAEKGESEHKNGNINNGGYVLETGGKIYVNVTDETINEDDSVEFKHLLCTYSKESQNTEVIAENCLGNLNTYGDRLFFNSQEGIVSCDFSGNILETYYDKPCYFNINEGTLYFIDDIICSLNLETKEISKMQTQPMCVDMNIGSEKIYYLSPSNMETNQDSELDLDKYGKIYSVDLNGSNNKMINSQIATNLILNGDYLYYIERTDDTLQRMNSDTYEVETLSTKHYLDFNISNGEIIGASNAEIDILTLQGELLHRVAVNPLRHTAINLSEDFIFYKTFASSSITVVDRLQYENIGILGRERIDFYANKN